VDQTKIIYVKFLCDVACQKLLKLANVSQSHSENNTGTVFFWDTVYMASISYVW